MFRGSGQGYHALGRRGAVQIQGAASFQIPILTRFDKLTTPLGNRSAVTVFAESAAASGRAYYNCVTTAVRGLMAGLKKLNYSPLGNE